MTMTPSATVRNEPVAIAAVVRAIAYILIVLGFDVDPETVVLAIMPAVEVITSIFTRRKVTPIKQV